MGKRFVEMKGGAQSATPGEHPSLSPRTDLEYNSADELIFIKKYINGVVFKRDITDPNITDYVVARTVSYSKYVEL